MRGRLSVAHCVDAEPVQLVALQPPTLTSEAPAREFRDEMPDNFETYFSEATHYFKCIGQERDRIRAEINETAARYDRFLKDSSTWE